MLLSRLYNTLQCCVQVSIGKKNLIFCDFSWEGGGTLPQIVINLPGTYEKLSCKGKLEGSAVREVLRYKQTDIVVQEIFRYKQTDRLTDILLLLYKD